MAVGGAKPHGALNSDSNRSRADENVEHIAGEVTEASRGDETCQDLARCGPAAARWLVRVQRRHRMTSSLEGTPRTGGRAALGGP